MDPNKNIVPVRSNENAVQGVKRAVKRRRKLLVLIPLLFVLCSVATLYFMEPKYKSSTTILIQQEEPLNPFLMFDLSATSISSDNRLKSYNEIVYSRSTLEILIDSLNLARDINSEHEKQNLVDKLRKNIETDLKASDSFEITYYDTDPVRARNGVDLLANHFIDTRLKLDNRRTDETVKFFQTKIEELEEIVDKQRDKMLTATTEQMKELPMDPTVLQTRLQNIDSRLDEIEWQVIQEENKLETFNEFLNQESQNFTVQPLYTLSLEEVPLGTRLGNLLEEYDRLRQQFTDNYPEVRSLRTQILEVAKRIPTALKSRLSDLQKKQEDLRGERASVINDLERSFVAAQRSDSQKSNFSIYQELYSDMKVKLEQARMAREIDDQAQEQFVVVDKPFIPEKPSSPSSLLVIGAGLVLGIIFGSIFMWITEFFDTTVRSESDLEYEKPIIAYLSDG